MKDLEQSILRARYTISAPVIAFERQIKKILFSHQAAKNHQEDDVF
jgi:hypothetical protein